MYRGGPRSTALVALLGVCRWASGSEVLYFSDTFYPSFEDGAVRRVSTDGTGLETVVNVGGGLRGMFLDEDADWVYWTNVDAQIIGRTHPDGTGTEWIVQGGISFPNVLAVDRTGRHLFWGDQGFQRICRSNLDGSDSTTWLVTDFHAGLAIDSIHGKLYWTSVSGPSTGRIMRANLDGSGVESVVLDVGKPAQLALDPSAGKIYWTDYVDDVVRRANVDGTGMEDLFVAGSNLNPGAITLDPLAEKVYWAQATESNRHNIMRMNLDGSNPETVMGAFGFINALQFVPEPTSILLLIPAALRLRRSVPYRRAARRARRQPTSVRPRIQGQVTPNRVKMSERSLRSTSASWSKSPSESDTPSAA